MSQKEPDYAATAKVVALMDKLREHGECGIEAQPTSTKPKSKLRELAGDNVLYEYAEHDYLGDSLDIPVVGKQKLVLDNGVQLSYGQINGLAGDLFGTMDPFCLGKTQQDCEDRFTRAYNTLAGSSGYTSSLLSTLESEVESFKTAQKPSEHEFSDVFEPTSPGWIVLKGVFANGVPTYLRLGAVNLDHFGNDARTAYNTGHRMALQKARDASPQANPNLSEAERKRALVIAYTMNGFADHFLEDRFSSGHLRTPRRVLWNGQPKDGIISKRDRAKDLCSKVCVTDYVSPTTNCS